MAFVSSSFVTGDDKHLKKQLFTCDSTPTRKQAFREYSLWAPTLNNARVGYLIRVIADESSKAIENLSESLVRAFADLRDFHASF